MGLRPADGDRKATDRERVCASPKIANLITGAEEIAARENVRIKNGSGKFKE